MVGMARGALFGTKDSIFHETYFDIGIEGLCAGFLLVETCQPGVAIGVRDMETSE